MDTLTYWTLEDSLSFRCRPEEVGQLRPADPGEASHIPEGADELQRMALSFAPRAMRTLARLMETGEGRTALAAAQAILAYAYPAPPPAPPAPPVPLPPPDAGALAPPPWVNPAQRLSYAAGQDDCLGSHPRLNN